jgi:hypothetical protein
VGASATLDPVACCAPLTAPLLSNDEAAATAELFKALADPARVRILNILRYRARRQTPADGSLRAEGAHPPLQVAAGFDDWRHGISA